MTLVLGLGLFLGTQGGAGVQSQSLFLDEDFVDRGALSGTFVNIMIASGFTFPEFDITHLQIMVRGDVASCYYGVQAASGDVYDAESLTQVTFGGQTSVNQGATSETLSDLIEFSWNKTDNLIFSTYSGLDDGSLEVGGTEVPHPAYTDEWFRSGVDSASTADKSGFGATDNTFIINQLIVYG